MDFRGERRVNETHESRTDTGARLARKGVGKEARLCYEGHMLMDNWQGLVDDVKITEATGTSERDAALDMLEKAPGGGRITVGADRGYDTRDFVGDCLDMHVTPHVAQRRHSAVDGRTTRHDGYRLSQRVHKRVEKVFGWVKTVGGGRNLRYQGVERNQMWAKLTVAGYNLVRLARLAQRTS